MAIRNVKAKSHEKLDNANVQKVIDLLNQESPITKKEACEILNIRYNTTRLQKIIEEHLEMTAFREKRKSQNRGKGATKAEIRDCIQSYIEGENISNIAKSLYRSNSFVKAIIERVGVPQKLPKEHDKCRDIMLPEQCVAESFEEGEIAWSAKNNGFCLVLEEYSKEAQAVKPGIVPVDYEAKYGAKGYKIYVLTPCDTSNTFFPWVNGDRVGYYSFSLAYDLGNLKHLEEYGVKLA